jgi:hypothetical protein
MRGSSLGTLLFFTACVHQASTTSRDPHASDFEVYRVVLDSMFSLVPKGRYSRIAVVDSTEVFKRATVSGLIQSVINVPELIAQPHATSQREATRLSP